MLGPQVRHQLKALQKAAGDVPVEVIDMRDYGTISYKLKQIFLINKKRIQYYQ